MQRIIPGPGQESVWDYPRPPRLEPVTETIIVVLGGVTIVTAPTSFRVLETSHPPSYYIPTRYFTPGSLTPARGAGSSLCEWKGQATYYDLIGGGRTAPRAAWGYSEPTPAFAAIADCVALYAGHVDLCTVGGANVTPQPGAFYGGWITPTITGPFKGIPGSSGW
jgi:uncharacterized protein (DUF427 family)